MSGVTFNPDIYYLHINGAPLDYVIEVVREDDDARTFFFWYIVDFPPFEGEREDLIITFE